MQKTIPIFPPAPALNPIKDAAKVEAINYTAEFENLFGQFNAYPKFYNTDKTKNNLVKYIPGLTKPVHQGQIEWTMTKKAYADDTYKSLNPIQDGRRPKWPPSTSSSPVNSTNVGIRPQNFWLLVLTFLPH